MIKLSWVSLYLKDYGWAKKSEIKWSCNMSYLKVLSLKLTLGCPILKSKAKQKISKVWYIFLSHGCDTFFESLMWYIFLKHGCDTFFSFSLQVTIMKKYVTKCDKHLQNMFKRDDLQSSFRIFLAGCRLFATIEILITLLVTNLTGNTKNYFF